MPHNRGPSVVMAYVCIFILAELEKKTHFTLYIKANSVSFSFACESICFFLMYFLPCVNLLHNTGASTATHIHNQLAHKLPLSALFDSPPHVIVHMFTFKRMYKSGTGDPCTHADIDWKQSLPQIRIRICSLWSGFCCLLVGCLPG